MNSSDTDREYAVTVHRSPFDGVTHTLYVRATSEEDAANEARQRIRWFGWNGRILDVEVI